ncbi:uncharacterized protein NEPG_00774 [Nematocida parisii ERTm1]|uniref:uncharacterized protein n=1 Tax=Nematocida parisii (strain ERTm1 / ATCC PRA-289) TaxID=881290 RepID=UPI000264B616|nr:uncharacterized protein NEPG_00774 [Nematocida parisii ERTm1]EIJ94107.1 hypothetical protein NEPG_00774 [Nematocida parisii ERTm1]|eukprot:XP_013058603.1 hypothetical protein NEPG_00774 [Nematocida parisii ERTm1]
MNEKKRYAWLEMYAARNKAMTYDSFGVTEPFNEFFEGILKINPSLTIKRLYITSLHIAGVVNDTKADTKGCD